jgi:outer membrane lipoprotein-sorting protein
MGARQTTTPARRAAAGLAVAGIVGLGLLVIPPGASAAPQLPPVTPDDLVGSVLTAQREPFQGTVSLDNALGLPALPGAPMTGDGVTTARVWSNGAGGERIQLPTDGGERTLVSDGTTSWAWDSADRTVVTGPRSGRPADRPGAANDPTTAADDILTRLRGSSTVTVDGTAEVAGRAAYELVLSPLPTERTLLREIRIAVDGQKRTPLRLVVLGTGSPDPALRVEYTEFTLGAQDPALFTFTPPPGSTVRQRDAAPNADRRTVGDGWDAVTITTRGAPRDRPERAPDPATLGRPVSGPWGTGRLITTAVGSVIVTDDGRVASGAVPEQLLVEALGS